LHHHCQQAATNSRQRQIIITSSSSQKERIRHNALVTTGNSSLEARVYIAKGQSW
jgi:hypothetical protein